MKKGLQTAVRGLCLFLPAIGYLGCSGTQVSLVETGAVRLENAAPGKVYVAWSDAYERDGRFVITGVVRRKDTVGPPIKVTVDAEIVSASGTILDTAESDALYVPRRRGDRVQGFERFTVRFPEAPPAGSSVRITARSS